MTSVDVADARGHHGYGSGRDSYLRRPVTRRASTHTARMLYPWSVGGAVAPHGIPLGNIIGERGGGPFCCDPLTWYRPRGYITNPSVGVIGLNGWGKSAVAKRWLAGLTAFGVIPMIPADVKGEYVEQIKGYGGQAISIGPGRGYLNLLDLGSAPAAARRLGLRTTAGDLLMRQAHRRRQLAVEGFIGVLRGINGAHLDDLEKDLLSVALSILDRGFARRKTTPLPADLAAVFTQEPDELKEAAKWRGDPNRYYDAVTHLERNIDTLARGSGIAESFSRPTSVQIHTDTPTVLDLSGIPRSDVQTRAAAQLACWAHVFGEIAVSHALSEAGMGSYPDDPYRVRWFVTVLDELWDFMRTVQQGAHLVDELGRLNRSEGVVDIKITHSLKDDHGMGGIMQRCGFIVATALPPDEFEPLRRVSRRADVELDTLASWATPAGLDEGGGKPRGLGRVMVMLPGLPGFPVQVKLMPSELAYTNTSKLWDAA